eukprot:Seg1289.5 transcript_id=Seg1289.5/GoldUCD/mRNA.D3Y31 product="hypothetical protein" protein_id=Seg1289.5/GoldUCD/D3Y31
MHEVESASDHYRVKKEENRRLVHPLYRQSPSYGTTPAFEDDFKDGHQQQQAYSSRCRAIMKPIFWINTRILQRCFCSDGILKFLVCICYGIIAPCFKNHVEKKRYSTITIILMLLQWSSFMSYIYFVNTYWNDEKYGPTMPTVVKFIQMGLIASCAFNLTLGAWFLYSKSANFTRHDGGGISIIPQVRFSLPGNPNLDLPLKPKDWLFTNIFLLVGFMFSSVVIFIDFEYNTFYDFPGMHNFVARISPIRRMHYHLSVTTEFFGFYATVCTICVYHALTRDLIHHIDVTEEYILTTAKDRDDFQAAIDTLLMYDKKLMQTIKWWFAVHTFFFTYLIVAIFVEWFQVFEDDIMKMKNPCQLILAQMSGSFFIAFKFAFPFLSASRVTARYTKFYYRIARRCMIPNLPRLSILHDNSGITLIGVRITTKLAVLAFLCSFLGALKFITGWKE